MNHLLYANDTCIVGKSPAACQYLLDMVQGWLEWANLRANLAKSRALCIKASTGKYDSQLCIGEEKIHHLGDSSFMFLGMRIQISQNLSIARSILQESLERMLKAIDSVSVTSHQKIHLYKQGVCPRLTWLFHVEVFPISFLEKTIQPLAIHFLKKWTGLARAANPALLFMSPRRVGLLL